MAKIRTAIPQKTKALLQQEINSVCPFCNDDNVDHFEIHHLDENPTNNELSNLLMLCPICHSKITKQDISGEQAIQVKAFLQLKRQVSQKQQKSNTINIRGNVKGSTIANTITAQTIIHKSPSKPKIELPEGSIGRNVTQKNYIKHLIDRYNEFKESEVGKGNLKYSAIYGSIIKEFKASAFQIPEFQFYDLVSYLQGRINNTRLGRINKSKGIRNYSEYEEIYTQ